LQLKKIGEVWHTKGGGPEEESVTISEKLRTRASHG